MTDPTGKKRDGFVALVGAGPGDPGLITRRGLDLLRAADVVVFDALANPSLLEEAPESAERIDVGKRARQHKRTQDQINELLFEKANAGKRVVRLKGGDPYLFGRGAEEAAYLAERGVRSEVVPGVTSGIAAPAAAGIPVTHRKLASTVTFITGHEDPTKDDSAVDYAALAALGRSGGTLCFYMAMSRLAAATSKLIELGLPADTPAAAVQWGTLPRQRRVVATLESLAAAADEANVSSPAIVVIGAVAGVDEPGLDYFMNRPLFGQRIVITRTRHQASALRVQLEELGALVLEAPTIELRPPDSFDEVDQVLGKLADFDWLVLTSVNGVAALRERLEHLRLDGRTFASTRIAAIGSATADAINEQLGLRADLVPTRFVAESLAHEMLAEQDMANQRVLLLRADIARPALPQALTAAGAQVVDLPVYRTVVAEQLPERVVAAFEAGEVDWVTFTSASTAANLHSILGPRASHLANVKLASIGPITSDAIRELGLKPATEAEQHDIPGLVDAIRRAVESGVS